MSTIDLSFKLTGESIPLDHGYALMAALCRVVPSLHGNPRIGVHPIRGRRTAPGVLELGPEPRLRIRLPSEQVAPYIALIGSELELDGHRIKVETPRVDELAPSANLASRMVTFRNSMDAERFEAVARRDLEQLGVSAAPALVPSPSRPDEPIRRVLAIKGRKVVGYALRVHGLSADESLVLQAAGLGGRRRMGCGLFTPFSPR